MRQCACVGGPGEKKTAAAAAAAAARGRAGGELDQPHGAGLRRPQLRRAGLARDTLYKRIDDIYMYRYREI